MIGSFTYAHVYGRWFLGEVSNDAAASILKASDQSNVFVVYSSADTGGYTLSAR